MTFQRAMDILTPAKVKFSPEEFEQAEELARHCMKVISGSHADGVEVVRCRDCKHYFASGYCAMHQSNIMSEMDFCSYGKRSRITERMREVRGIGD